jgi:ribosomal-protein-alanine N-acetyltransferase
LFAVHYVDGSNTFLLRNFEDNDAESLSQNANNPKIAGKLTDAFPHPYQLEDAQRFIAMAQSHSPARIFTIDYNGEACGGMGIHPQNDIMRKNAELGYWLAEPLWGKGIISVLIPEIIRYGFNHFDIDRIYARPFGSNLASQKVLLKAGFVLEAHIKENIFKWDRVEDELIYGFRRSYLKPNISPYSS